MLTTEKAVDPRTLVLLSGVCRQMGQKVVRSVSSPPWSLDSYDGETASVPWSCRHGVEGSPAPGRSETSRRSSIDDVGGATPFFALCGGCWTEARATRSAALASALRQTAVCELRPNEEVQLTVSRFSISWRRTCMFSDDGALAVGFKSRGTRTRRGAFVHLYLSFYQLELGQSSAIRQWSKSRGLSL